MSTSPHKYPRLTLKSLLPLAGAYVVFLMALSIDILLLYDTGLLEEGPPRFELIYLIRTGLVALSSGLLVFGLARGWLTVQDSERFLKGTEGGSSQGWTAGPEPVFSKKYRYVILWGTIVMGAGFLTLFIADPRAFYLFGKEDNFIEVGSALIWFLGGLLFLRLAYLSIRSHGHFRRTRILLPLLLGLVCVLVSLEEISWFQRVFSLETPSFMVENVREEINFHNYATDEVEIVYYLSTFLSFILLPFAVHRINNLRIPDPIRFFIPSRVVVLASALAVAYNYDMWNILFIQFSFFVTLFILLTDIKDAISAGRIPWAVISLVLLTGLSQGLFLFLGDRFVRTWDVTEYKEFIIPLAVFVYSFEVSKRFAVEKAPIRPPTTQVGLDLPEILQTSDFRQDDIHKLPDPITVGEQGRKHRKAHK